MPNWLDPELLAQETHGAIGFGYILSVSLWINPFGLTWSIVAWSVFEIIIMGKEALWDPFYETDQPLYPAGLIDFGFYQVGILLALMLLWIL